MIRIMLADSHDDVRRQLAERLSREKAVEVVGQAATAADMLERIHSARPDVLVVDPQSKGDDFLSALKNLRYQMPNIRILVLSSVVDTFQQVELNHLGVHRILNKGLQTDLLLKEILAVMAPLPRRSHSQP